MPQVLQTNVIIGGAVDQSLAKSMGIGQAQLKKLQDAIRTITGYTNQSNLAAAGLPGHFGKAVVQVNALQGGLARVKALKTVFIITLGESRARLSHLLRFRRR
jgi:hypothetical protein